MSSNDKMFFPVLFEKDISNLGRATERSISMSLNDKFPVLVGKKKSNHAFVLLVMKGDSYMLGAMVCAFSLMNVKTTKDIVLMVTDDVSDDIINCAKHVFTTIVRVPYIQINALKLRTVKQQMLYESWKNVSPTKWNCLALDYEKVIFIDADKIVFRNIDHLFDLATPAGTFSSPHSSPYKLNGMANPYLNIPHGSIVPKALVKKGLHTNHCFTVIATTIVLSPSLREYETLLDICNSDEKFGYHTCNSMIDEQLIAHFYSTILQKDFTNIHQKYNYIPWHKEWLEGETPYLFHYFGIKPWELERDSWSDLEVWYTIVKLLLKTIPDKDVVNKLYQLYRPTQVDKPIIKKCCWCNSLEHLMISEDGKLECDKLIDKSISRI